MKEKRQIDIATPVQIREADDGKRTLVGIIPYNSRSVYIGFIEVVTPTAFSKTLSDGADVKALYAHNRAQVLGRVKNGTLRLTSTDAGLVCECDLPDTSYARDVYALIKDDYVTTMSFGFDPINYRREIEDGQEIEYLTEAKLSEVSFAVSFPAYAETASQAREVRGIDLDNLETLLAKEPNQLSSEDRSTLENVNRTISTLIEPSLKPDTVAVPDTTAADFAASLLAASTKEL